VAREDHQGGTECSVRSELAGDCTFLQWEAGLRTARNANLLMERQASCRGGSWRHGTGPGVGGVRELHPPGWKGRFMSGGQDGLGGGHRRSRTPTVGLIVNEGLVGRFILNRSVARSRVHDKTVGRTAQVARGLGGLDWRIGRAAKRAPVAFGPFAWRESWSRTGSWAGMRYPVEAATHLLAGRESLTCCSVEWQGMARPTVGAGGSLPDPEDHPANRQDRDSECLRGN